MSHARRESQEVLDTPDFDEARHGESREALAPTAEHDEENGHIDGHASSPKHADHAHDNDHSHGHGHDHHHDEHHDAVATLSPGKQVRYVAEVQQQRLLVTSASRSSLTIQSVFEPTPIPVSAVAAVTKSPSQIALARRVPREERYYLDLLSRADDYSKLSLPVHRAEGSDEDEKQVVTVDFTAMPVEFALYIYSFLGPRDVVSAFAVSKKMHRLLRSEVQSWVVTQPHTIQSIPKLELTRLFIKFVWNAKSSAANAAPHTVSITSLHGHGHKHAPPSQKMSLAAVVPGCDCNAWCNDFFCCRDPACMTRFKVMTCRDKRATCLDVICMAPCGLLCLDCEGAKSDMVVRGDFGEDFEKCCGGCGRSGLSYKDTGDITGISECVYCGLFGTAWCARNICCWSFHCATCQLPYQCQSWKTFNNNLRQFCTADLNCYN